MEERPALVGGGLLRSLTGESPSEKKGIVSAKPFLGEAGASVLQRVETYTTARQLCHAAGFGLLQLSAQVVELLKIEPAQVSSPGKPPERVRSRSLYCYWTVRELRCSATALARANPR